MRKTTQVDAYTQAWYNILAYAVVLATAIFLSGCYTERTAQRQVDKAHHKQPAVLEKYCADKFDGGDSTSYVSVYLPGETVTEYDTVYGEPEALVFSDTVTITRYITKTIVRVDTVRDEKYAREINKAAIEGKDREIAAINATMAKVNDKLLLMTDSRDDWKRYAQILAGIIGAYLLFRVVKWYFFKR